MSLLLMSPLRCLVFLFLASGLAGSAGAEEFRGTYALRALGVKVGEFTLSGRTTGSDYAVSARLATTGLVGSIRKVRFFLMAKGRRDGPRFLPRTYTEDMETGRRQTRVGLTYSNGVATASGSEIGEQGPYSVSTREQRWAVDPLTAIFMVLRDQNPADLCRLRQKIYDGERLTEISLTRQVTGGGVVRCTGAFTRVGGYAPDDLRNGSRFPLTITYEQSGDVMRAVLVQAQTIYGPASIIRK